MSTPMTNLGNRRPDDVQASSGRGRGRSIADGCGGSLVRHDDRVAQVYSAAVPRNTFAVATYPPVSELFRKETDVAMGRLDTSYSSSVSDFEHQRRKKERIERELRTLNENILSIVDRVKHSVSYEQIAKEVNVSEDSLVQFTVSPAFQSAMEVAFERELTQAIQQREQVHIADIARLEREKKNLECELVDLTKEREKLNKSYDARLEMNRAQLKAQLEQSLQQRFALNSQYAHQNAELELAKREARQELEKNLTALDSLCQSIKETSLRSITTREGRLKAYELALESIAKQKASQPSSVAIEKHILFENAPFAYPNMLQGAEMRLTVYFDTFDDGNFVTAKLKGPFGLCSLKFQNEEIKDLPCPPSSKEIENYRNPANWQLAVQDDGSGRFIFDVIYRS